MTKVSIVIPNYNSGDLLRTTLNSLRLGGWENIEVIVQDGASSDHSLAAVEDFPDLPISVTSESDDGQYDAINKGMAKASGDILCWINAGDFFLPGSVGTAVTAFEAFPDMQWLTGRRCIAEGGSIRRYGETFLQVSDLEIRLGLCSGCLAGHLQQEGMFWRRELWEEAGPLDLRYQLAADFELWTRFAQVAKLYRAKIPLAAFSYHETNRSISLGTKYREEVEAAVSRLPEKTKKARKVLFLAPPAWRICRRIPGIRWLSAKVFGLIPDRQIKVLDFERKGSTFTPVCKDRMAWIK